jgi:hypothetical protein
MDMHLISPEGDRDALELACFALQMPFQDERAPGKMGQVNLRDRAEAAGELLASMDEPEHEELIDRTTRLLRELPQKSPPSPEARLLADAVNLEDFGVVGLFQQAMNLCNAGVEALADGIRKRQQYGYWEARLKDGFHFEPIRQLARRALANARKVAELLLDELEEDESP